VELSGGGHGGTAERLGEAVAVCARARRVQGTFIGKARRAGRLASWRSLPLPFKPLVRWRTSACMLAGRSRRTGGQRQCCRVRGLRVVGRRIRRVLRTDRRSRARLDVRMVAYGAARCARVRSGPRERGGAFRCPVHYGLGHFDHDFFPNFELKCVEE
jgi:hypothetical protein